MLGLSLLLGQWLLGLVVTVCPCQDHLLPQLDLTSAQLLCWLC